MRSTAGGRPEARGAASAAPSGAPATLPSQPGRLDQYDALSWLLISGLLLSAIHIGFASGDGVAQATTYARGTWVWNPNHLWLEPVGAWWQRTLTALGLTRADPDKLKLLSIWSGAIAAGLFRWLVAGRIAPSRFAANHGTAWFALGAAFNGLWISDEAHMLQMPFLVLGAAAALRHFSEPKPLHALAVGAAVGLASLVFVSNSLLAFTLAGGLALSVGFGRDRRRALETVLWVGLGAAVVAGGVFLVTWHAVAASTTPFLHWLRSYSGGTQGARVAAAYGARLSLGGLALSAARAVYGGAGALVDVSPVVQLFRDGLRPSGWDALNALALAAAVGMLMIAVRQAWRDRARPSSAAVLAVAAAWGIAVFGFALFWNNSDDQFYFQLAVPLGMLVACTPLAFPRATVFLSMSLTALTWNVGATTVRRVFYPRAERAAILAQAVRGAGLIVSPGHDEVDVLFYFVPDSLTPRRMSITELAAREGPADGVHDLTRAVCDAVTSGQRVDLLSMFDVPPLAQPWKYLRTIGYERGAMLTALERFDVEPASRHAGPFTIRSILPSPKASCPP